MKKSKRLTISDLTLIDGSNHFIIKQDKKGRPKIVRKRSIPVPYELKYRAFFRLIKDNPSIPDPVEEFKFHPTRKWRIDICWPEQKLALEIEGGVWTNGGHVRPTGFIKDIEKYNALTLEGFSLLRFTPQQMGNCESYDFVREWFKKYGVEK